MHLREIIAQPVVAAFCAGGVAGAVSRTVVSPLERLKILFQIQSVGREEYKLSVGKGLMKMWKDEGWRGFMRGNGTNCIRIVPYSAVQFGSYNFYKKVVALPPVLPPSSDLLPFCFGRILTSHLIVLRSFAGSRFELPPTLDMRWCRGYYFCMLHISSGHC
jgi:hypothetical protein